MEVRPGYKQTELGLIPEDWEVVRFLDIADKSIPWSIFGGPFGSNLKTSDYTIKGVRIIQLQNIGDGRFHDDFLERRHPFGDKIEETPLRMGHADHRMKIGRPQIGIEEERLITLFGEEQTQKTNRFLSIYIFS